IDPLPNPLGPRIDNLSNTVRHTLLIRNPKLTYGINLLPSRDFITYAAPLNRTLHAHVLVGICFEIFPSPVSDTLKNIIRKIHGRDLILNHLHERTRLIGLLNEVRLISEPKNLTDITRDKTLTQIPAHHV